jgi:hypothetical protein
MIEACRATQARAILQYGRLLFACAPDNLAFRTLSRDPLIGMPQLKTKRNTNPVIMGGGISLRARALLALRNPLAIGDHPADSGNPWQDAAAARLKFSEYH